MKARPVLALGVGAAVLYLVGAALSGRASPLARRPLLDGLAPPTPYRWVSPPPALAAANRRPSSIRFTVRLTGQGSELVAFSTPDGQANLVLSQGAVPARAGQTSVVIAVDPLAPSRFTAPPGLLVAGNTYRVRASYRPSGAAVTTFGGQSSIGLVYPLLSAPVASPSGHLVLASADGRSWERLASTDAPGAHQVSAPLTRTGYVQVAVPPAAAQPSGGRSRTTVLLAASGAAAVLVLAAVAARRVLATGRGAAGRGRGGRTGAAGAGKPDPARRGRPNPARRARPHPSRRRRRR
jgi:hypothetical protein